MYIKSIKKYNPMVRFSKFVVMLMILSKVTTNCAIINFIAKFYFYLKKKKKTFQSTDHIYKMLGRILKMLDSC